MESISSMKMMAGAFFSASSNALRRLLSDSPAIFDIISGPLIKKKNAPVSLATARAIRVFPDPGGPYSNTPRGGLTPSVLKSVGCRKGSSIISRICAICFRHPPTSSYPTSSIFSSSSRLTGSPSQWMTVSGATIQYGDGSVSTTLNSTGCMADRTRNKSPFLTGRYASRKYGLRYTSNRLPDTPSIVSSNGKMWIRFPYGTSPQDVTVTTSLRRTRRFLRTTLFIRTFESSQVSSARTIQTVSFPFFPLMRTVSPRNNSSCSILAGLREMTELSSFVASSTINRFGLRFFPAGPLRIASFISASLLLSSFAILALLVV
mmetsp:Transcript_5523/g.13299  ORF Transcript_5523/g.13299 Transcript_5523/m.13299 type:complete len:319 (+) Transcript_5523:1298-2254(+)